MTTKTSLWDTTDELNYLMDIGFSARTNKHVLPLKRKELIRRYISALSKRDKGDIKAHVVIERARAML